MGHGELSATGWTAGERSRWARRNSWRAEVAPPIEVMKTYAPVKTTEVKPGVVVYDLGQNFAGWPDVKVRGREGRGGEDDSGRVAECGWNGLADEAQASSAVVQLHAARAAAWRSGIRDSATTAFVMCRWSGLRARARWFR